MNDIDKILKEYLDQLKSYKKIDGYYEQISTLLLTHLYIEYFLNLLIEKNFKIAKKILEDHNRYTFSVKLDIIYEKDFIPEWLYFNIKKFNKIRNLLSHNLHFDIMKCDLTFKGFGENSNNELVDLKAKLPLKSKEKVRNSLIILHIPTYTLINIANYIKEMKYI
jgi:uncharacterized protein YutE (UPF0331/DUF86 family)